MEARCNSLAVEAAAGMVGVAAAATVPAHATAIVRPGTLGTARAIRGTRIGDTADGAAAAAARAAAAVHAAGVVSGPALAQVIVGDKVQIYDINLMLGCDVHALISFHCRGMLVGKGIRTFYGGAAIRP